MSELPLVFTSLWQLVATCLVMILAEGVYVMFGFGAGMIAVGALAMVMPEVQDVVVLVLLVNLPPELFVVNRAWRQISWTGVGLVAVGLAIGVPAGAQILKLAEPTFILILLGAFLVVAGGAFLVVPDRLRVNWPKWTAPPVGLFSGVLAGLFGTGGPPLIFYYQLSGIPKAVFRGNLMAIFLVVTAIRLPVYAAGGLITVPRLFSAVAVMPAVLLGAWLGHRIHVELEEGAFRRLVSMALVLIGLMLLVRQQL